MQQAKINYHLKVSQQHGYSNVINYILLFFKQHITHK